VPPKLEKRVTHTKYDNLDVVWLKTLKYKTAKSFSRVLSWLHFEWNLLTLKKSNLSPPDVVIVSSLSLLTILNGLLLKRRYRCKLVFEIRDIWPLTLVEEGGFRKLNPFVLLLGLIERIGYAYSDVIVGTMPNLSAHVEEVLSRKKKVFCIPMGIPPELLISENNTSSDTAEKFFPKNKFIVLYAGTIGITNALETLFKTAIKLQEQDNIHFVIMGDGPLLAHYKKTYGDLSNLSFLAKVSKSEVPFILKKADLLYFSVFQSKVWEYGQSLNKIIDYMFSGKPIIGSYSGFESMINEADCGCFVPAGDTDSLSKKIIQYSELTPETRELIGKRGKEWLITHRTYSKLALDYSNILFSV